MRNLLFISAIFLISLFLCSCSGSDQQKTAYELDKLYYKAQETEKKVLGIKPEIATPEDIRSIISDYKKVVEKYKSSFEEIIQKDSLTEEEQVVSNKAGQSALRISQLSMFLEDTIQAISYLENFEETFPHNFSQTWVAWLTLSEIYDAQRKWAEVEDLYLKCLEKYDPPATEKLNPTMGILKLPYELLRFHKLNENEEKVAHYTQYAINYYKNLREKYPESNLGIASTRYLAETYKTSGEAQQAIDLLKSITDSTGQMTFPALLLTAQTYRDNFEDYPKAIEYYQKILEKEEDSLYTPQALMELGQIYLLEDQYQKSRDNFYDLIEHHSYASNLTPRAQQLIAYSYEQENNFDQALTAYTGIIEKYPSNSLAFDTYIYLPDFFLKYDKKQLSDQWYNRAEEFFIETRDDYSQRNMGASAQEYLSQLYVRYEKYDRAVEALKMLAEDFSEYQFAQDAFLRTATIYEKYLNLSDSAKYYYQKQIDTYPDLSITNIAKEKINNL